MTYTPFYPGGWRDFPNTTTPIDAAALQNIENGLIAASNGASLSGLLLAAHVYAPASLATPTCNSTTLAAFDSTNIQTGSFVAPASGSVIVDVAFQLAPPSTQVFGFALAEHGTVVPVANTVITGEVSSLNVMPFTNLRWIITGLTPGTSHNFDLLGATATASPGLIIRALGSASTTPTGAVGGPVSLTVTGI
jgi:hypothetical protein